MFAMDIMASVHEVHGAWDEFFACDTHDAAIGRKHNTRVSPKIPTVGNSGAVLRIADYISLAASQRAVR